MVRRFFRQGLDQAGAVEERVSNDVDSLLSYYVRSDHGALVTALAQDALWRVYAYHRTTLPRPMHSLVHRLLQDVLSRLQSVSLALANAAFVHSRILQRRCFAQWTARTMGARFARLVSAPGQGPWGIVRVAILN